MSLRLERLVASVPDLIGELSLDGLLQRIADVAAEVIGARYAAFGLLAPDGRTLETFTTHGVSPEERARMGSPPRGYGILGMVIHQGRAIRLSDLNAHPLKHGFPPNHPPMHSFLGVPVVGKRGVLGDLYVTEKIGPPGAEFTEEDEHLATLLAARAAAAIENVRLHEESARLLEEVQQLHRNRERFFAMVNHELRNSLAAVFGSSEMLTRRKDPKTVPRAAFEVLDSAEQAISLINDLLDLSRLDEDRLRPVIREVDMAPVIRHGVSRVTPIAQSKQVQFDVVTPEAGQRCSTDPARVEQILVNLLGNAVRHSPQGGTVRITLGQESEKVTVMIEDEGSGIAPEDLDRVFDIYQTKSGQEGQGSGLGLPLSRRLARLLGGDLRAICRLGAGGCFLLELPSGGA